jgi:hypothetical protein
VKSRLPRLNDADVGERLADIFGADFDRVKAEAKRPKIEIGPDVEFGPDVEIVAGLDEVVPPARKIEIDRALIEMEQLAFAAADRGDFEPLVKLMLIATAGVPPATRSLILELLWALVERTRTRGRPRMTTAQRRKVNPIHDAADEVDLIVPLLREKYPDQKMGDIREAAVAVAVARVKRRGFHLKHQTLLRHVARSRADRRRV